MLCNFYPNSHELIKLRFYIQVLLNTSNFNQLLITVLLMFYLLYLHTFIHDTQDKYEKNETIINRMQRKNKKCI